MVLGQVIYAPMADAFTSICGRIFDNISFYKIENLVEQRCFIVIMLLVFHQPHC